MNVNPAGLPHPRQRDRFAPREVRVEREGRAYSPPDTVETGSRRNKTSSLGPPLMERLVEGAPAYSVQCEKDGYLLVARAGHMAAFADVVREAAANSGNGFIAFVVNDGMSHRYSRLFVMPLEPRPDDAS